MCGFYDDEQKIKKGDRAVYNNESVTIISAKHITNDKTMDIVYKIDTADSQKLLVNIPYKTVGYGFELLNRVT
ncbi:MAG: hypothetical protein DRG78_17860 [Epsilonproteobacteria bacterium]|nr:MAG: hypothetical protein DRG78_17860 [Campylobacterota bacterium]